VAHALKVAKVSTDEQNTLTLVENVLKVFATFDGRVLGKILDSSERGAQEVGHSSAKVAKHPTRHLSLVRFWQLGECKGDVIGGACAVLFVETAKEHPKCGTTSLRLVDVLHTEPLLAEVENRKT
jgi:hypothetical protein